MSLKVACGEKRIQFPFWQCCFHPSSCPGYEVIDDLRNVVSNYIFTFGQSFQNAILTHILYYV